MFDIGWPELLVIAIVLIIVVGPKDLPPMLRAFGRTTKKLKSMANEFRGQFDDALREAELGDVKKTFDDARKLNPMQTIRDAVNPLKDAGKEIRADLEKSVKAPSVPVAVKPPVGDPPLVGDKPKVEIPPSAMKLADGPPEIKSPEPAAARTEPAQARTVAAASPAAPKAETKAKPAKTNAAPTAKAKPAATAQKAPAPAKPAPRASKPKPSKPKQGEGQA